MGADDEPAEPPDPAGKKMRIEKKASESGSEEGEEGVGEKGRGRRIRAGEGAAAVRIEEAEEGR